MPSPSQAAANLDSSVFGLLLSLWLDPLRAVVEMAALMPFVLLLLLPWLASSYTMYFHTKLSGRWRWWRGTSQAGAGGVNVCQGACCDVLSFSGSERCQKHVSQRLCTAYPCRPPPPPPWCITPFTATHIAVQRLQSIICSPHPSQSNAAQPWTTHSTGCC